ncbi:type II secretion system F family protein [Altererythrobacter lutimaris]|uniref:Type II secretion system F family protein n=1 Tax=Altererythrobacter lutimaris TaxID=2743979 RepID=A0A850HAC6_9SPHN|nr:type II secretion system F family protein [Altererythrobacter lutimaris]NVE94185.1 type II secretion system F family protein [Altererythrobacter lutimaris]
MIELASSNWIIRALLLVVIFGLVALVVFVISNLTSRRLQVTRELAAMSSDTTSPTAESLTRKRNDGAWAKLAKQIENAGLNLGDTAETEISKQLKAAGYMSPTAPRVYTLVRLLMIFVFPCLYLLAAFNSAEPPSVTRMYFTCGILMVLGLYVPNLFIRAKAERRRQEIVNGFPDALDLMLVCVEAGLGLESTLDRVGREVVTSHPRIASMLTQTTLRMRAGATREDSLRKMGDEAGVDEIRSFSTLLVQSDKLGTSLAQTLRVYAAEMREARRLRAEEKAHRLPVLISIPLVLFMLPSMIGVLTLPAIVRAIREIMPALS